MEVHPVPDFVEVHPGEWTEVAREEATGCRMQLPLTEERQPPVELR